MQRLSFGAGRMGEGIRAEARRRPARLADVAELAGVSTATVSRALAAPDSVNAGTRAQVLHAVRALGYTPNVAARNLRVQRTRMALVIVANIGNAFFSDVLRGIDAELARGGHGLVIGNLDDNSGRERGFVDMAFSGAVDGILLLSLRSLPADGQRSIASAGLPMVALCEELAEAEFPQVTVGNRAASIAVVRHLAGLGHRRIGHIAGPHHTYTARERALGFREGVAATGLAQADCPELPGDYHFASGHAAGQRYLALPQRPTAIYAANDEMAVGFVKCVHEAGLRVPRDVSVVGFDGVAFGDFAIPTLTTVLQPRLRLGEVAASLLLRQLAGEVIGPVPQLAAPLVVRDSTGPVGASAA